MSEVQKIALTLDVQVLMKYAEQVRVAVEARDVETALEWTRKCGEKVAAMTGTLQDICDSDDWMHDPYGPDK